MKLRQKQGGFGASILLSLLLLTTILTLGVVAAGQERARQRILDDATSFYNHVAHLKTALHAYASDQYQAGFGINTIAIFPNQLSLLEGRYIPTCSDTNNKKGICRKYDQTPWGQINPSDYRIVPLPNAAAPTHYRAELTVSLPDKTDIALKSERNATLQLFAQMPNVIFDDVGNRLIIRIDRPDKAFAYDALVKRSGDDSTLLGDWDTGGNFAITNAKDLTLAASDGSQILVSNRLMEVTLASHGDWINKPVCISGQQPRLRMTPSQVDVDLSTHTLIGGANPYVITQTPNQWQVGMSIQTKRNSDGQQQILTTGKAALFISCR